MKTLLIDGDWLAFKSAIKCEEVIEWDPDQFSLNSDAAEAFRGFASDIQLMKNKFMSDQTLENGDPLAGSKSDVIVCLSSEDSHYFRHDIYPAYKGNRKGVRKPLCYKRLLEKIKDTFRFQIWDNLEADDLMGIAATSDEYPTPIIVTVDKDLDTVPGIHFNPMKSRLYLVNPSEAEYNHKYQTLLGDTTDGFKGCPGVGPKKAAKILAESSSWERIGEAFLAAGLSLQEACVQAQLAYILQAGQTPNDKWEDTPWLQMLKTEK